VKSAEKNSETCERFFKFWHILWEFCAVLDAYITVTCSSKTRFTYFENVHSIMPAAKNIESHAFRGLRNPSASLTRYCTIAHFCLEILWELQRFCSSWWILLEFSKTLSSAKVLKMLNSAENFAITESQISRVPSYKNSRSGRECKKSTFSATS